MKESSEVVRQWSSEAEANEKTKIRSARVFGIVFWSQESTHLYKQLSTDAWSNPTQSAVFDVFFSETPNVFLPKSTSCLNFLPTSPNRIGA